MSQLNPKEAPYGCTARLVGEGEGERWRPCTGCYFDEIPDAPCTKPGPMIPGPSCISSNREDLCDVIFVKEEPCPS